MAHVFDDVYTLGFPRIPKDTWLDLGTSTVTTWIRRMRTDMDYDYFLLVRSPYEIRQFVERGGDPAKVIVHHHGTDKGVNDPLWSPNYLLRWIDKLKEWGVNKIASPDFSIYWNMPLTIQLHNLYRIHIVSRDFADAGFKILPSLPTPCPNLMMLAKSLWHDIPVKTALWNIQGIGNRRKSRMPAAAIELVEDVLPTRSLILARTTNVYQRWLNESKWDNCTWLPTVSYWHDQFLKAAKPAKLQKGAA